MISTMLYTAVHSSRQTHGIVSAPAGNYGTHAASRANVSAQKSCTRRENISMVSICSRNSRGVSAAAAAAAHV